MAKRVGGPLAHSDRAEYAVVIASAITLISDDSLLAAKPIKANQTEGDCIVGGTTRAPRPGDIMLIPAGVPHWFGITGDHAVRR